MCAAAQQNFYLTTKLSQVTSPGSESTELTLKTLLDEQQRETQHLLDEQRRLRGVAEESQGQLRRALAENRFLHAGERHPRHFEMQSYIDEYEMLADLGPMLIARLEDTLADNPDYKVQAGKMVIEAKPANANKGKAVEVMLSHAPFLDRTAIMVGDDTTDEDAFKVVNRLGGQSIKVGSGETAAGYRVDDPQDVTNWLIEQGKR